MKRIATITNMNDVELEQGLAGTSASWHRQYAHCDTIYIGGLSDSVTEDALLSLLEQYGVVLHLTIARDAHTNLCRGYAFARYADRRSCALAIDNFTGILWADRNIVLDYADDRKKNVDAGVDTTPPHFYERPNKPPADLASHHRGASNHPADNKVESRREAAVMERLHSMRERTKETTSKSPLASSTEPAARPAARPAHPAPQQQVSAAETPFNAGDQETKEEEAADERTARKTEKERKRREKERRKAERDRIREQRAKRRAARHANQTS